MAMQTPRHNQPVGSAFDAPGASSCGVRVLVTAGPTHEPIDAVRYLANRSSGAMGTAIALACCDRGWSTTLLLGPGCTAPSHDRLTVDRFRTCADLKALLEHHWADGRHDLLIMAAAVADYRPAPGPGAGARAGARAASDGKIRRSDAGLTLNLESTPDLVAAAAAKKLPQQRIVAFALEEPHQLERAARDKLERKGVDAIVANPLDTMNSDQIAGSLIFADGAALSPGRPLSKPKFAIWLLETLLQARWEAFSRNRP